MRVLDSRIAMVALCLITAGVAAANFIVLLSYEDDRRPIALTVGAIGLAFFLSWAMFRYLRKA